MKLYCQYSSVQSHLRHEKYISKLFLKNKNPNLYVNINQAPQYLYEGR